MNTPEVNEISITEIDELQNPSNFNFLYYFLPKFGHNDGKW